MTTTTPFPGWLAHLAAWQDRLRTWLDDHPQAAPPLRGGRRGMTPEGEPEAGVYHVPVMAEEVVHFLGPRSGSLFLDCTLGGGGHSERLLQAGASVLALDQDPDALEHARQRLSGMEDRIALVRMNFRNYPDLLREVGLERELDGILMDLGVSSWQLDTAERGFSFMHEGPLDMRMDPSAGLSAADLLATAEEDELRRIFRDYGEEPQAARIARAIVRKRSMKPLRTTRELAELVAELCGRRSGRHPATRVFQALRIAVNDELGALQQALEEAPRWLKPGGRLAVITFHSLEDRLVKQFLHRHSQPVIDRPEWPAPRPNPDCHFRLVIRKGLAPSETECARNPRARSARLRVAERLPHHEKASQTISQ